MFLTRDQILEYHIVRDYRTTPDDITELSYGFDPHGYTFRLAPDGMRVLDYGREVLDPKVFDRTVWISVPPTPVIDVQPGQFVCGWSIEYFVLPTHITGIIVPKSCYSRIGLSIFGGVCHAGWEGRLVVEFQNRTTRPIRVYANEGIASVLFAVGADAEGYCGRYQGQGQRRIPQ